ncbi:MAG: sugar phosphate isomerase/epimerase family protein [Opitutales bacterium]
MPEIIVSTAIGCGYDLETALQRVRSVGAKKVDLLAVHGFAHVDPLALADRPRQTLERLGSRLMAANVTARCLNSGFSAAFEDRSETAIGQRAREAGGVLAAMKQFGLSTAVFETNLHGDGRPWSEEDQRLCMDSIEEVLALAQADGRTLALELHERTAFETPRQIERLLDRFPEIPLAYDPTHLVAQGVPLKETAPLLRRAAVCHLRDAAAGKIQTPFGDGEIDFDWVSGELESTGFNGPIVIEYLGFGDDTPFVVESSKRLYELLLKRFS